MRVGTIASAAAAALAAGCGFSGSGAPDASGVPDADTEVGWSLRTRADFEGAGIDPANPPVFTNAMASPRDIVEPFAYAHLGLLARASDQPAFAGPTGTWADVQAVAATGVASIMLPAGDYGLGFPSGVGITAGDGYTAWYEGEIFLEAGAHAFTLEADSCAFLELDVAPPVRVADCAASIGEVITATVDADGWFPIRIAHVNQTSVSLLHVLHDPPGAPPVFASVARTRLRTRADALTGLLRFGFDGELLSLPRGASIAAVPMINEAYGAGAPGEVGILDPDSFSQRLGGHVWIDADGPCSFVVDSDDGFRIVVDGQVVSDPAMFDLAPHVATVGPVMLTRGWHDIAIDHVEWTGDSHLGLQLGGCGGGGPIAPDKLRPIVSGRERFSAASARAPLLVPAAFDLRLDAPASADITQLAVTYDLDHPDWSEIVVTVTAPWGATAVIRDQVAGSGRGMPTLIVPASAFAPDGNGRRPADGLWRLDVDDVVASNDGTLHAFALTQFWAGGEPAIPLAGTYTSGVHDFGTPRSVARVTTASGTPTGAVARVSIRTCDALPCASTFLAASSIASPLAPARYAQVKIDFISDGVATPFVDDIDVFVTATLPPTQ